MTKFEVGDKVRIKDINGIGGAVQKGFKSGDEAEVYEVVGDGFYVRRNDGLSIGLFNSEAKFLEKVSEEANPKPTKNQRITALEEAQATLKETVEQLKARVEQLGALVEAQQPKVKISGEAQKVAEEIAESLRQKLGEYVGQTTLTPNQKRKAIIDEAKAFVAENLAKNHPDAADSGVWFTNNDGYIITDRAEFIVNDKKRVVVVLIKDIDGNDVYTKGIAKCAPDDVFNADIGKAIALGRALGLDVSKFEQAVKPTEVVVGQKVFCGESSYPTARSGVHTVKRVPKEGFERGGAFVDAFNRDRNDRLTWVELKYLTVKDDTEAQY